MIYLTGITKAKHNCSKKFPKKFKRLKIPFGSVKEIEEFILNRSNKFNMRIYPMYQER